MSGFPSALSLSSAFLRLRHAFEGFVGLSLGPSGFCDGDNGTKPESAVFTRVGMGTASFVS